ncbi:MAG: tripartite tricarboxylate transporter substrate binding protein, partial [Planctomycetales bacterium]|nr:tripartite tricarboxylate transporter substrate binding protein [Planctomycetales bacterium]
MVYRFLLTVLLLKMSGSAVVAAQFPTRPIKLVVYTAPGGPIDYTARQFAEIARQYTDATFVVENKPGAGGVVAIEYLLRARPDGHTILACTKSNVAKLLTSGHADYLDRVDWFAMLIRDRECVITRSNATRLNWPDIIADAQQRPGEQQWLGPGSGGLDHVTALQIWDAYDVRAKWIPFKSGGEALTALLGGDATAYVGNPGDATGNPNLRVSIISSPARLEQFPDVPTFGEFGHAELDDKFMWRGLALPDRCPAVAREWWARLCEQVTADKRWQALWRPEGMEIIHLQSADFRAVIEQDRRDFEHYLAKLDLLPSAVTEHAEVVAGQRTQLACLVGCYFVAGIGLIWTGTWSQQAHRALALAIAGLAGLLLWQTTQFPAAQLGIGAAAIPRFWIGCLFIFALLVMLRSPANDVSHTRTAETVVDQQTADKWSRHPVTLVGI